MILRIQPLSLIACQDILDEAAPTLFQKQFKVLERLNTLSQFLWFEIKNAFQLICILTNKYNL